MDKTVDLQLFHPNAFALAPPYGMKEFSVRWTGFLTPSESGTYQVGVVGSRNRLWLDGKLIVDDPELHDPKPTTTTVQLEKGHHYPVKLEFLRGGFGTKLVWLNVISDPIGRSASPRRSRPTSPSRWSASIPNSKAKR